MTEILGEKMGSQRGEPSFINEDPEQSAASSHTAVSRARIPTEEIGVQGAGSPSPGLSLGGRRGFTKKETCHLACRQDFTRLLGVRLGPETVHPSLLREPMTTAADDVGADLPSAACSMESSWPPQCASA